MNTSMCYRLLEALSDAPMTTRTLAERLDTNATVIRARLAELRRRGNVRVVAAKAQRGQCQFVWARTQEQAA